MHPFAFFPELLNFQIVAPFLLRITVGLFLIYLGYKRYKKPYNFSAVLYVIVGAFLVLGWYTQISAIVAILVLKLDFYLDFWINKSSKPISEETWALYTIAIVVLLSLLLTGPGFLAMDLPL